MAFCAEFIVCSLMGSSWYETILPWWKQKSHVTLVSEISSSSLTLEKIFLYPYLGILDYLSFQAHKFCLLSLVSHYSPTLWFGYYKKLPCCHPNTFLVFCVFFLIASNAWDIISLFTSYVVIQSSRTNTLIIYSILEVVAPSSVFSL